MTNWTVYAVGGSFCRFPDGLVLEPGERFTFETGPDAEDDLENGTEACKTTYIWDDNRDEAILRNADSHIVDRMCWHRPEAGGRGMYPCVSREGP
jgi:hypothetical protein